MSPNLARSVALYMNPEWLLFDTPILSAPENIALDRMLLGKRQKDEIPNSLRFLQFFPCVLIGYHQTTQEARREFCKARNIEINRRITGGGAIYFDEKCLGYEIIAKRSDLGKGFDKITERLCNCVVYSLRKLNVNARFRPRNDIEVEGRKIGGSGGVFEGEYFLFQGTLLLGVDLETMFSALQVPIEKLSDKELASARERVTSLSEVLKKPISISLLKDILKKGVEECLGVKFKEAKLPKISAKAIKRFSSKEWIEEIPSDSSLQDTIYSSYKVSSGLIKIGAKIEGKTLRQILVSGDFFVFPQRRIFDLEAYLKDTPLIFLEEKLKKFFAENPIEGISHSDLQKAISFILEKEEYRDMGISIPEANKIFTINGGLLEIIRNASFLLVPYCAKPIACEHRNATTCNRCGECSCGEAYNIGERNGLTPITILNYENLKETLKKLKSPYIGSCCSSFFNKHQGTFRKGPPCVLIDIESKTCYELKQEKEAYQGNFENQTSLNIPLLKKVIEIGKM
ncbi:MAG: lipoate--protein ligase family protein [bacterium]